MSDVMKVHILYLTLKHTLIFGKFIFPGEQNDVEFNDLKLSDNVTIPRNWKCDKCDHIFKLSIDQLISRIKRYSFYCTNCKATFDTSIKVKANPLLHTDRNLF